MRLLTISRCQHGIRGLSRRRYHSMDKATLSLSFEGEGEGTKPFTAPEKPPNFGSWSACYGEVRALSGLVVFIYIVATLSSSPSKYQEENEQRHHYHSGYSPTDYCQLTGGLADGAATAKLPLNPSTSTL